MKKHPSSQSMRRGSARIVIWNVEWAAATSDRGKILADRIEAEHPDLVCLTEAPVDFSLPDGHIIAADPDYGYGSRYPKRRKVQLWSRNPWSNVDLGTGSTLPGGRFVRARTAVPFGSVDVWGVCIPWRDAHVRTGRRDREGWEDHIRYLEALGGMLEADASDSMVLVGDYNQRVPRQGTPKRVAALLSDTIEGLELATEGLRDEEGKLLIDHLAHGSGIRTAEARTLSRRDQERQLTDHTGVRVDLCPNDL